MIKYSNQIQVICMQLYSFKCYYLIQIIYMVLRNYSNLIILLLFTIIFKQIYLTQMLLPLQVRVNPRVMAMKRYSRFPQLKSHYQMQVSEIPSTQYFVSLSDKAILQKTHLIPNPLYN